MVIGQLIQLWSAPCASRRRLHPAGLVSTGQQVCARGAGVVFRNSIIVAMLMVCVVGNEAIAVPHATPRAVDGKLPSSGELSRSINSGDPARRVPDTFGGIDVLGNEQRALSGSVSRVDQEYWNVRVFNNSAEDTFSVNVGVKQFNDTGGVLKTDYFSYLLKPHASTEQMVQAAPGASEASLELRNYRKLTKPTAAPSPEPTVAP